MMMLKSRKSTPLKSFAETFNAAVRYIHSTIMLTIPHGKPNRNIMTVYPVKAELVRLTAVCGTGFTLAWTSMCEVVYENENCNILLGHHRLTEVYPPSVANVNKQPYLTKMEGMKINMRIIQNVATHRNCNHKAPR